MAVGAPWEGHQHHMDSDCAHFCEYSLQLSICRDGNDIELTEVLLQVTFFNWAKWGIGKLFSQKWKPTALSALPGLGPHAAQV